MIGSKSFALASPVAVCVFHAKAYEGVIKVTIRLSVSDRENNIFMRTKKTVPLEAARAEYARLTKLGWEKW